MYKNKFISAIITAAGSGSRMGAGIPKLELEISGKSIIEITISKILSANIFDEIILVTSDELLHIYEERFSHIEILKIVKGGDSREESTYFGIKATYSNADIIFCHDGARPNVDMDLILKSVDAAIINGAAIVAVKAKDTIKYIDNGFVESTLDRNKLYQVQTPQVFKAELIRNAYNENFGNIVATDDSSFVEALGHKVSIVEGSYDNFKITTMIDYLLMKMLMEEI